MRLNRLLLVVSLTLSAGSFAAAQNDLPKVRSLGQPVDSVLLGFRSNPSVRVLSNGRLLATDIFDRRLIMIAEDLKAVDTLFDATSPAPLTYPGYSPLLAAVGDTTLFYDSGARGYRVIDPSGRVARRLSIADQSLTMALSSPATSPAIDPKGRVVFVAQRWNLGTKRVTGLQPQAESLVVARATLDRLGYDSITAIMGSGQHTFVADSTKTPPALGIITPVVDRGDAWTMTSTGAVAIIRASDFHVDWIEPDGSRRSTPPIPWAWEKYSRADRDTLVASRQALMSKGMSRVVSSNGVVSTRPMPTITLDTLPDRVPAFVAPTARADGEGRIWLQLGARLIGPPPTAPAVYAIIDNSGRLVDRVELPAGRTVVGFDRLGYVYALASSRAGYMVERYLYPRP